MENECEALTGVAYPGVRDNRSTINTKTGYDDDDFGLSSGTCSTISVRLLTDSSCFVKPPFFAYCCKFCDVIVTKYGTLGLMQIGRNLSGADSSANCSDINMQHAVQWRSGMLQSYFYNNKNLAVANRSRVSSTHNMLRAFIGLNITL